MPRQRGRQDDIPRPLAPAQSWAENACRDFDFASIAAWIDDGVLVERLLSRPGCELAATMVRFGFVSTWSGI